MESQEPTGEEAEDGHVSVSELSEADIAPSGEEGECGMTLCTCSGFCSVSYDNFFCFEVKGFAVWQSQLEWLCYCCAFVLI